MQAAPCRSLPTIIISFRNPSTENGLTVNRIAIRMRIMIITSTRACFHRQQAKLWWALFLGCFGPLTVPAAEGLTISWTNEMLTIRGDRLPGQKVDIWYLEAFCRSDSTHRDWHQTVIPHRTELVEASADGHFLELVTTVEPRVEIKHEIRAGQDEVTFQVEMVNRGDEFADVQWFQPCMRVGEFTKRTQEDYWPRSFIYTRNGFTTLDQTRRTEDAWYRGGQVYVPKGIDLNDVNPRPLSPERPVNGLIGAISYDDRYLLAMAWDKTQELFQGVIVCLHNDPHVGGLQPGETKRLFGKVYFLKNDPDALVQRYQRDFARP